MSHLQVVAAIAVAAVTVALPAFAGEGVTQTVLTFDLVEVDSPCRLRDLPVSTTLTVVPEIAGPGTPITLDCQVEVEKNGEAVRKAKGHFDATLHLKNREVDTEVVVSGKYKTDKQGTALIKVRGKDNEPFVIPSIDPEGLQAYFEFLNWFSNKKKATDVAVGCGLAVTTMEK